MTSIRLVLVTTTLLTLGCRSFEHVDLQRYAQQHDMPIATSGPPADAEPIGLAHAQEGGFYLLGVLPIVQVGLRGCLDRMIDHARSVGAHGIADVRYEVEPAEFFKFSVFPLPDWSARVAVTGTLYRRKGPSPIEPTAEDPHTPPGTIRTAPSPAKER